jgi:hypothetical protein
MTLATTCLNETIVMKSFEGVQLKGSTHLHRLAQEICSLFLEEEMQCEGLDPSHKSLYYIKTVPHDESTVIMFCNVRTKAGVTVRLKDLATETIQHFAFSGGKICLEVDTLQSQSFGIVEASLVGREKMALAALTC